MFDVRYLVFPTYRPSLVIDSATEPDYKFTRLPDGSGASAERKQTALSKSRVGLRSGISITSRSHATVGRSVDPRPNLLHP